MNVYVPKLWKDANVTPIHKKDIRTVTINYRNVSLTLLVFIILEGLIRDKLSEFCEKRSNRLKFLCQHSLVKRKACVAYIPKNWVTLLNPCSRVSQFMSFFLIF